MNKDVSGAQEISDYQIVVDSSGIQARGTGLYVVMLGGYRVFYALNWIYKKVTCL